MLTGNEKALPLTFYQKLLKNWRGPFQITELHQVGHFYRLRTGRAAHYEKIKPHNDSSTRPAR